MPVLLHAVPRGLLVWMAALLIGPALANPNPSESWVVEGKTYTEIRVQEVTPATVTIFHRGGICQLPLSRLPADLQERFGYDPEKSEEWTREAAAGLEATGVMERQALEAHASLRSPSSEVEAWADAETGEIVEEVTRVDLLEGADLRPVYASYGLHFKDQGRRPSCAVFALVSAVEYELARQSGLPVPLSEEFLIWAVRKLQPGIPIDTGFHFPEVISALQAYGVPRQAVMPNTFGRPVDAIKPTSEALFDASTRRNILPVWYRPGTPDLIPRLVHTLNHGTPVVVGLRWPNWRTLEGNHLLRDQLPLPGAAHAVTLVGYQCPDRTPANLVFIFRNSYGINWGLGGYGFVAASYLREHLVGAFHVTIGDFLATDQDGVARPAGD